MTLEMRELKGDDLFALLAIVGKLEVKDEFIEMFEKNIAASDKIVPFDHKDKKPTKAEQARMDRAKAQAERDAQTRGMEMAATLLQKTMLQMKHIKQDINELLADLTNTDVETISNLGLKAYTSLLIDFFKKPELADFFSSIASLLSK